MKKSNLNWRGIALLLALVLFWTLMIWGVFHVVNAHATVAERALPVAARFWADRGLTLPCKPRVVYQDLSDRGDRRQAEAQVAQCTILIDGSSNKLLVGRDGLERKCAVIVHEYGHLLGLQHTASGVMNAWAEVTPWTCVKWAGTQRRHYA